MIRPATIDDAPEIAATYNYYIENTIISLEEEPISDAVMSERISSGQSGGR